MGFCFVSMGSKVAYTGERVNLADYHSYYLIKPGRGESGNALTLHYHCAILHGENELTT